MLRFKILFGLLLPFVVISCSVTATQYDISCTEARELMKEETKLQILDVRTPLEVSGGVIYNAINVDWFSEGFVNSCNDKLDKDLPVLVYCKAGGRSAKAVEKLKQAGYKLVYNLEGGYTKWNE